VDASPLTRSTNRLANGRTHTPWSCANPATMALSQSNGSSTARRACESCATATLLGTSTIETTSEMSVRGFHGMCRSPVSRLILSDHGDAADLAVSLLSTRLAIETFQQLWLVVETFAKEISRIVWPRSLLPGQQPPLRP